MRGTAHFVLAKVAMDNIFLVVADGGIIIRMQPLERVLQRLTDAEIAEIRRRRPGVRASLACEGMYLTPEEEAMFDQTARERLSPDERAKRITEIFRAKRRKKALTST
jgi:hypothetical protein